MAFLYYMPLPGDPERTKVADRFEFIAYEPTELPDHAEWRNQNPLGLFVESRRILKNHRFPPIAASIG